MRMRIFVALAAFLGFVPLAHAAPIDTYEVTSPGPLDSFNIRIRIESADHVPVLAAQWRYDFPDALDPGEFFEFNWDPDIVGDPSYGAIVSEQVGMSIDLITAVGTVSGVLAVDGDHLSVVIPSPSVPESSTILLLAQAWPL